MKLLTQEIKAAFKKFPFHSQRAKKDEALVVAKFFDPTGRFTFFATEGVDEDEDFLVYGYCVSPLGPDCDEWGNASMNELQATKVRFGLGIERDIHFPIAERTVAQGKKELGL